MFTLFGWLITKLLPENHFCDIWAIRVINSKKKTENCSPRFFKIQKKIVRRSSIHFKQKRNQNLKMKKKRNQNHKFANQNAMQIWLIIIVFCSCVSALGWFPSLTPFPGVGGHTKPSPALVKMQKSSPWPICAHFCAPFHRSTEKFSVFARFLCVSRVQRKNFDKKKFFLCKIFFSFPYSHYRGEEVWRRKE